MPETGLLNLDLRLRRAIGRLDHLLLIAEGFDARLQSLLHVEELLLLALELLDLRIEARKLRLDALLALQRLPRQVFLVQRERAAGLVVVVC